MRAKAGRGGGERAHFFSFLFNLPTDFRRGTLQPRVVPFQVSLEDANRRFEQWHAAGWLSPRGLLTGVVDVSRTPLADDQPPPAPTRRPPSPAVRALLLPFWLFEVGLHVDYRRLPSSADAPPSEWHARGYREYPWTLAATQVCASYALRRDLVRAATVPGVLARARALRAAEAAVGVASDVAWAGGASDVPLAPRDMRQGVAWRLCLHALRDAEAGSAARALARRDGGGTDPADVQVRLRPVRRRARVVYLPAYLFTYALGERRDAAGSRRPAMFQALVSGLDAESVAGERHLSPARVRAACATGAGGVALVASTAFGGWPPDPASLALTSFLAAAAGGLAARASTHALREASEAARLAAEDASFERAAAGGLGPTGDAHGAAASEYEAAEWRRWADADRWHWHAPSRRAWADALWRDAGRRRVEAARARAAAAAAAARMAADAAAASRRRERFGGADAPPFMGSVAGAPCARRDHHGHYRALGLALEGEPPTPEAVRSAFREAALRLHPDRQPPGDTAARARAASRFARARAAYELLRDPVRRADYDAGGLGAPVTKTHRHRRHGGRW